MTKSNHRPARSPLLPRRLEVSATLRPLRPDPSLGMLREIRRLIAELADTKGQPVDMLAALDFLELAARTVQPLVLRVPFAARESLIERVARAKAVLLGLPPSTGALRFAVERRLDSLGPHYNSLPENKRGAFAECVSVIIQAETGAKRLPSTRATQDALQHGHIPADVKPSKTNPLKLRKLRSLNALLTEMGLGARSEKSLEAMLDDYADR
jgi:hypothetical protein